MFERTRRSEHAGETFRRQRAAEQIALHLVAAVSTQELPMLLGFDTDGDKLQAQRLPEGDGGKGMCLGVILVEGRDERSVDLQATELQCPQCIGACIARLEGVDGQRHTQCDQLLHDCQRALRVGQDCVATHF